MPHQSAQLGPGALRQVPGGRLLVFRLGEADLDQLVGQERLVDGAKHRLAEPRLAHLDHRAQGVSARTKPLALGAAEGGMGVFLGHGERDRLACAPVVPRILLALVLLLAAACASPPPPAAPAANGVPPPAPESAAAPPAAIPEAEAVPEPAPPDPLLASVEAVLAERAPALSPAERAAVAAEIVRAERDDELPALLVLALIEQESRFDPGAVGPRGSLGLMQIRPFVGADVSHRHRLGFHRTPDLLEPALNVAIGTRFLAELHGEFDDIELALAAYHIGPTRVRARAKHGWRPRGPYVRRVMGRYQALRVQAGEHATAFGG